MINKIEILSPGSACRRTQKTIKWIKTILERNKVDFELEIITNQDLFTNYKTWILPTVIINNQIISRGYKPSEQQIIKAINE